MTTRLDSEISVGLDESTRLLCVAAQLDREFARSAIREFLAHPARALPPATGVDARVVLRECLAAHQRRRVRDGILGVLMVIFAIVSLPWLIVWVGVAMGWRMIGPGHRRLDGDDRRHGGLVSKLVFAAVLAGLALFVVQQMLPYLGAIMFGLSYDRGGLSGLIFTARNVLAAFVSLAMLAVIWFDRYTVWTSLTQRLRRGRLTATSSPLRDAGPFEQNLRSMTAEHVDCVVYRGPRPFVGSGQPHRPWSVAVALEADSHQGRRRPGAELSITALHEAVTREVRSLAVPSALSPSQRLRGVRAEGRVLVPARALSMANEQPLLRELWPDERQRPRPNLSAAAMQYVVQDPQEWMRFYATYVVESWDREVTVSIFMHYGLDQGNLYVECIPCVLRPVNSRYRAADSVSQTSPWPAGADALGSWTVLPLTILPRLAGAVRRLRDDYSDSVDVEQYGTRGSLREMAAAPDFEDYSQVSDVNRYLQILQTRIIRAIGAYLESCEVSVVDFMRQAGQSSVTNYWSDVYNVRGGVSGSSIGGQGNVTVNGNVSASGLRLDVTDGVKGSERS
ncbi:MAG: hypothetical protein U0Q19_06980 [Kineosporiaceae bacterium]